MSSYPLDGTILIVVRVPLTISFDDDVLHSVWGRVQNVTEIPAGQLAGTRNKGKPVSLPIDY